MTPQELKNSILQLAIQGKLVEQRPEEGTAEELYRQIQSEKQKLIKEGKIKKEKPLPEITEEEKPFDIPESWDFIRLDSLCTVVTGKRDANFGSENGKYYFFTCAKDPIRCDSYSFSGEALLLAGNGDIGNISYYNGFFEAYQRTYVLQPYIEHTYLQYIYYHLLSNWVQYNLDKTFGTAIPYIRLGNLQNYLVALPPLAEQKRIVAKIEELLPLIDRYEKAWSRLEEFNKQFPGDLQKSILQIAIQGKLVEQRPEEGTGEELYQQIQAEKQKLIAEGKIKKEKPLPEITEEERPFDIPESWKWVRLVELGVFSSGKTPTMGEAKYWNNGTVQWFTSKDMKSKYLTESEMKITEVAASDMTKYPAGTLLMVVRSGILKRTLPLCILTQDSTINQDIKAYQLYDLSISEYVYYMIKGLETYILKNYRKQVTTVDSLKFDEFSREMLVPLPPLSEQKRIVAKLDELLPLAQSFIVT